jgi:hypothetical protein
MVSLSIPTKAAAVLAVVAVIAGGGGSVAFFVGQVVGAILFVALVEAATRATATVYRRVRGVADEQTT